MEPVPASKRRCDRESCIESATVQPTEAKHGSVVQPGEIPAAVPVNVSSPTQPVPETILTNDLKDPLKPSPSQHSSISVNGNVNGNGNISLSATASQGQVPSAVSGLGLPSSGGVSVSVSVSVPVEDKGTVLASGQTVATTTSPLPQIQPQQQAQTKSVPAVDPLDAYMASLPCENVRGERVGGTGKMGETKAEQNEDSAKVITLDMIMGYMQGEAMDTDAAKEDEDGRDPEFIAKLKALKPKDEPAPEPEREALEPPPPAELPFALLEKGPRQAFATPSMTATGAGARAVTNAGPEARSETGKGRQTQGQGQGQGQGMARIYNDDDDAYLMGLEQDLEGDDFLSVQKRQAEKKELKPVNHEEIEYEPFRKNFYIEVPEISRMSEKDVKALRKSLGRINVRGLGCPKPVKNWYQCGLSDKILEVIIKKGFRDLFPIQAQAIPAIMAGKDVIAIAETGSGKTLAYVLPMLRHVLDQRPLEDGEGPIALVMAPTRELAHQIFLDIKTFTKVLGLSCVCVYGGAGMGTQLSDLKKGSEIVVCTPGRMIDVLTTSNGKITNLQRITYIVLDEADRMLDMGFEPQISRVLANVRPDRQTIMCSATFPRQIETLAKRSLKQAIEIVVGNRGQTCRNVEQHVEVREDGTKLRRLLEILGEWDRRGSILIFVDKHQEADSLFKELFGAGYKALVLHGGQDQTDREFTIADFKNGVRNLMVATSLAARGLDIKSINLVVNYSCPNHTEDYVHRVGRTGRAGNKGVAITFITPDECQYAAEIIRALKQSSTAVPEELEELDRVYREKVTKGEMEKYRPNGFSGTGFKFTHEEAHRIRQVRKQLSKSFGFDMEASDSDSDLEVRDGKTKQVDEKSREQLIAERIRDPNVKQAAMDAATNAAKIAIVNGADVDGIKKAAEDAINKVIEEFKPTVSLKEGLEKVLQLRDDFESQEEKKNNRFSAEYEINDYPITAQNRVTQKETISHITEFTGCTITLRGVNVEPNKKPPNGQRRRYIHIDGPSKQEVQNAHKEIKRVLEDAARSASESRGGYGTTGGRYTVP
jgi:ATP-dependent RNA helicase DDX46/PRP5